MNENNTTATTENSAMNNTTATTENSAMNNTTTTNTTNTTNTAAVDDTAPRAAIVQVSSLDDVARRAREAQAAARQKAREIPKAAWGKMAWNEVPGPVPGKTVVTAARGERVLAQWIDGEDGEGAIVFLSLSGRTDPAEGLPEVYRLQDRTGILDETGEKFSHYALSTARMAGLDAPGVKIVLATGRDGEPRSLWDVEMRGLSLDTPGVLVIGGSEGTLGRRTALLAKPDCAAGAAGHFRFLFAPADIPGAVGGRYQAHPDGHSDVGTWDYLRDVQGAIPAASIDRDDWEHPDRRTHGGLVLRRPSWSYAGPGGADRGIAALRAVLATAGENTGMPGDAPRPVFVGGEAVWRPLGGLVHVLGRRVPGHVIPLTHGVSGMDGEWHRSVVLPDGDTLRYVRLQDTERRSHGGERGVGVKRWAVVIRQRVGPGGRIERALDRVYLAGPEWLSRMLAGREKVTEDIWTQAVYLYQASALDAAEAIAHLFGAFPVEYNLTEFGRLESARWAHPDLVPNEERRLAREAQVLEGMSKAARVALGLVEGAVMTAGHTSPEVPATVDLREEEDPALYAELGDEDEDGLPASEWGDV